MTKRRRPNRKQARAKGDPRPLLHYATLIALVISNISVLLLGALLATSTGSSIGELVTEELQQQLATTTTYAGGSMTCPSMLRASEQAMLSEAERAQHRIKIAAATNTLRQYAQQQTSSKKKISLIQLRQAAIDRKRALSALLATDPDVLLASILSDHERSAIARVLDNCIERPSRISGRLSLQIADDFTGKTAREYLMIQTNGTTDVVDFNAVGNSQISLEPGSDLQVVGYQFDNSFLATGNDLSNNAPKPEPPQQPNAVTGQLKTLVVLVYFSDGSLPSWPSVGDLEIRMSDVSAYYLENSYDRVSHIGVLHPSKKADVFGWYQIPSAQTCTKDTIRDQAIAAVNAAVPELDFRNYHRIVTIAPVSCSWAGTSTFGDVAQRSTPDGTVYWGETWVDSDFASTHVIGHELGHNLSLGHANFLDCGSVVWSETCTSVTYGNRYSTMGGLDVYQPGHFDAPQKDLQQWLTATQMIDAAVDGQYELAPIETNASALKVIRVPHVTGKPIYVEYRQPIGYDVYNNTEAFQGALLHIPESAYRSNLLDTTPPSQMWTEALRVGSTFTDPATNNTIKVLDKVPEILTVEVNICKDDMVAPVTAVASPAADEAVQGTITVTADATDVGSGIDHVDFYYRSERNWAEVKFATDSTAPYQVTLDTTVIPDGYLRLRIQAYDKAGIGCVASSNSSSSLERKVRVMNIDQGPPTVSLIDPADGAFVQSQFMFRAIATDDQGIEHVEWVPSYSPGVCYGQSRAWDTEAPYEQLIDFENEGVQSYCAYAYDTAGFYSVSSIHTFTVDGTPPVCSMTSPEDHSIVTGIVTLTAAASDVNGIAVVRFYKGTGPSRIWLGDDTAAPYSIVWDTSGETPGSSVEIEADACDRAGNCTTATPLALVIASGGGQPENPLNPQKPGMNPNDPGSDFGR